jgi:subtilase family serine protease
MVDGGSGSGEGSGEAALDIEDIAGLAPRAAIDVYQAPNAGTGNYDDYHQIITADTDQVISTSWGVCEAYLGQSNEDSMETLFEEASAQGQTVAPPPGTPARPSASRSAAPRAPSSTR